MIVSFLLLEGPYEFTEILAACTGIQDHRLPFFFPLLRTYSIKEPFSIFTLLFRAFSHLPSITDDVFLSPATLLTLPLLSVSFPSPLDPPVYRPGHTKLLVRDAYEFNPLVGHLCQRSLPARSVGIRLISSYFRSVISFQTISRHSFARVCLPPSHPYGNHDGILGVVDATPLVTALFASPKLTGMTRSTYRFLSASIALTPTVPRISSALWLDFWKFPISHVGRNIWYRALQFKLPHASFTIFHQHFSRHHSVKSALNLLTLLSTF
ncbi:hypothetical protein BDF14DRAFT_1881815 [Spinellus fusiger]|nr:hypothetical protein BDF14DRAFT_1881815 [Spinellus fusiger]